MINKYLDKMSKPHGFTLIELLIVIAIIGVLVTIVVIAIDPARVIKDSNDTKRRSELTQIKTALQLYFNERNDYPDGGEFTNTVGASPPNFTPTYMRQLPSWWGADGDYGTNGTNTDYDVGVDLENPGTEDTNSAIRCNPLLVATASADFFVCPD